MISVFIVFLAAVVQIFTFLFSFLIGIFVENTLGEDKRTSESIEKDNISIGLGVILVVFFQIVVFVLLLLV